jgi:hypothetical protein
MNPLQRLSTVGVRSVQSTTARKQRTQQTTSVPDRQAVHATIRPQTSRGGPQFLPDVRYETMAHTACVFVVAG